MKWFKKFPIQFIILLVVAGWYYLSIASPNIRIPDNSNTGSNSINIKEGETIRVKGEVVCLPHKDTDGPQTLECAFGIKDQDGNHYGLVDKDPGYRNISSLPTGEVAVVEGTFSEDSDSNYDIVGVINITSVEK